MQNGLKLQIVSVWLENAIARKRLNVRQAAFAIMPISASLTIPSYILASLTAQDS